MLKQVVDGAPVAEVFGRSGSRTPPFVDWWKDHTGLPSEVRRLRRLEEVSAKLKRIVSNLPLDKVVLRDVLEKMEL
ncbi:hypothetical protein AB4099_32880 [Bosea sp. 2KB_26]|uniref:hypothetical protein n=1 Tax=Bosea sp. 2KB_26 TaxID=3237475 RepID=UPI003F900E8D